MSTTINGRTYEHASAEIVIGEQRIPLRSLNYNEAPEPPPSPAIGRTTGRYEIRWTHTMSRIEARRWRRAFFWRCWKCFDGRTRAHHRSCPKRGGDHR